MNSKTDKAKKAAGTGFHADFKPTAPKRQIRFASSKQVQKLSDPIHKEFAGAFKILANGYF